VPPEDEEEEEGREGGVDEVLLADDWSVPGEEEEAGG